MINLLHKLSESLRFYNTFLNYEVEASAQIFKLKILMTVIVGLIFLTFYCISSRKKSPYVRVNNHTGVLSTDTSPSVSVENEGGDKSKHD